MPLELIFTPQERVTSNDHPHTFVLMVEEEAYERQKSDKSIPIAEVVDDFSLYRYENPGHSGRKTKPSKREIEDAFGTTNEDLLCEFMLINGIPNGHV